MERLPTPRVGMGMIKAVIFDVDGTLVDSVDLHAKAWHEAFAHFGYRTDYAAVRSQIGKGGDLIIPAFVPAGDLDTKGKAIEDWRRDHYKRHYMPKVAGLPRVPELMQRIRRDGKRIALASSAHGDELDHYKRVAGLDDLVEVQTTADDADKSKPFPDIFEAALAHLGLGPDEAVVVGDSPFDAIAARRAGLRVLGVLSGGFPAAELRASGAAEIYCDPCDLLDSYDRSLIARG